MSDATWYQQGLRFTCTRCGHCCTGEAGYVWVNDDELAALASHLGMPLEVVTGLYTRRADKGISLREKANGECVFYDSKRGCTIYPMRPRQCRSWPFWESNVATPQTWERTCQECPGAGQGELFSAEAIAEKLRMIRL